MVVIFLIPNLISRNVLQSFHIWNLNGLCFKFLLFGLPIKKFFFNGSHFSETTEKLLHFIFVVMQHLHYITDTQTIFIYWFQ